VHANLSLLSVRWRNSIACCRSGYSDSVERMRTWAWRGVRGLDVLPPGALGFDLGDFQTVRTTMDDMQQWRRREERPLAAGGSTERAGLAACLSDGPKRGAAADAETPGVPRIAILASKKSTTRSTHG
jgi:hypothetical protein